MKEKGFTLIELVAVILILAIISVVAIPIITSLIQESKEKATEATVNGVLSAASICYGRDIVADSNYPGATYTCDGEKCQITKYGENANATCSDDTKLTKEQCEDANEIWYESTCEKLDFKGEIPAKGTITIDNKGRIKIKEILEFDNIYCNYNVENKTICSKNKNEVSIKTIFDMAASLVYDDNDKCRTDGKAYEFMNGCYVKGLNENNYVWVSGLLWRIMGINADGSVKLITRETLVNSSWANKGGGIDYDKGNLKIWLNEVFYNILTNELKANIVLSEWCVSLSSDTVTPKRTTCQNNMSKEKAYVGAITADEFNLSQTSNSSTTYLDISRSGMWTLTPNSATNIIVDQEIGGTNSTIYYGSSTNSFPVRPVINIKGNSIITGGKGTKNEHYVVIEDKINEVTEETIKDVAIIGEYVELANKKYRVLDNNEIGVKLVLDEYYPTPYAFGDDGLFKLEDRRITEGDTNPGIGYILNNEVYEWLIGDDEEATNKIITSNWYQEVSGSDVLYPIANVKVGLVKSKEILGIYSMTTPGYCKNIWILTYWSGKTMGYAYNSYSTVQLRTINEKKYLRPVIIVSKDLKVKGGNGLFTTPYKI